MAKSPEDTVQIPGRRPELGLLIEAFAEHPVAMPVLVFDAVIVARPRLVDSVTPPGSAFSLATLPIKGRDFCPANQTTPPFRRDALRPFRLDHAVRHAPPGEARGRAFGNFGEHGQRLGRREEKRRALRLTPDRLGPG